MREVQIAAAGGFRCAIVGHPSDWRVVPDRIVTSFSIPREVKDRVESEAARDGISQNQVILRAIAFYFHSQKTEDNGAWDTDNSNSWYDPKRFFTFGEDRKGHSAKITVLIPKNLAGEIGRLIDSGDIPEYRSRTHFVRDAIYHRAKQVAEWLSRGELEDQTDLAMLISEEMALQHQREEIENLIYAIRQNAQDAMMRGDYEFLREYLKSRSAAADRIPVRYRDKYLATIREYKEKLREMSRDLKKAEGPLRAVQ